MKVRELARAAPALVGSTAAVVGLVAATALWIAWGFFVGFSDQWLLVPSAIASILALLLVVLLQFSQNRDTRAVQIKLDELIRAVEHGRNHLLRLEQLPDEAIESLETEFEQLREGADG
jgi:low affinity Fe/Cu permease